MSPDERVRVLASTQYGVVTRAQAQAAGLTEHAIAQRRRSRSWTDLHRGVYAIAGAPSTDHQRIVGAVLSLGARAVASSSTAAWLHDLIEEQPRSVHVCLPSGQHRRSRVGFVITEAPLRRSDLQRVRGILLTRVDRTIVDLAADVVAAQLEAALDLALVRRLTTVQRLSDYILDHRLTRRPGAKILRRLLEDRTAGALESELEREFLKRLRTSGLPDPVRQHRVANVRIDFAYPNRRVAIELDGLRYHSSAETLRADGRRQNALVLAGWTPFRFTWKDVKTDWRTVEATLRAALSHSP